MFPQVFSQANTPLKRWMLDFAFRRKESELKNGVVRTDSMWDKLIFKKVQVNADISPNPGLGRASFINIWSWQSAAGRTERKRAGQRPVRAGCGHSCSRFS